MSRYGDCRGLRIREAHHQTKSNTDRAGLWLIIGVPVFIVLWLWLGWWVLFGFALAIWATVDYIGTGGTGDVIDRSRYPPV